MTSSSPRSDGRPTLRQRVDQFLDERLGLAAVRGHATHKAVPRHRHTYWYLGGGLALFLLVLQVVTGMLLLLYYRPSEHEAYESIEFIMTEVRWGWLVRSLHSISANLLILVVFVHMASVYFLRAYRRPRELTWVTGVALFFIVVLFGFSGYLLPWNELSYFATAVGTEVPGAIPVIGPLQVELVRGGPDVTGGTLTRFFGLHVSILPMALLVLLGVHVLLIQLHGMSVPRGVREKGPAIPFVPDFMFRDAIAWLTALGVILTIIVLGPTAPKGALFPFDFLFDPKHLLALGEKADPFAPAPAGIKPEWYFLFMYQTLKLIPSIVMGLKGEMLGVLSFGPGAMALFLVPFVDRRASGLEPNLFSRVAGASMVGFALLMALFGTWCMILTQNELGIAGGLLAVGWILVSLVIHARQPADEPSVLFPSLGWLLVAFMVVMTSIARFT